MRFVLPLLLLFGAASARAADNELLVAAYDVAREVYKDLTASYTAAHPGTTFSQSHGGSSKQARAVIDGLKADVVAMNQALDVDQVAKAGLLPTRWADLHPHGSAPSWSTILFVVRKGNPKGIKDWSDLVRSDVAAWSYALKQPGGDAAKAQAFVADLLLRVPVLDAGGRGATTTFAQRGIGDVLLTFENEIALIQKEFASDGFEQVVPSLSIRADNPVAVVEKVAGRKGTLDTAKDLVAFHFKPQGQELFAKHHLRPADAQVLAAHAGEFPALNLVTIADFGGWTAAQAEHFGDGGVYDRIVKRNKDR